ncbi:YwdI family protein [Pseudalkalibacillus sp. A8]|uniref:YwdI family protein n=1 Tax=Pseudalkalibacillus sp. A8 TaxID=3382641 RepID=UPI0038B60193
MSIQSSLVVQKMIDRLESIKGEVDDNSSSSQVRNELSAIKAYCDLLMEATGRKPSAPSTVEVKKSSPAPVRNVSAKRLKEDDDVNGDSIFDF